MRPRRGAGFARVSGRRPGLIAVFSIWPMFVCLAALLGVASLPLLASADAAPGVSAEGADRVSNIDGLRGFLALAVFFHHAAVYEGYLRTAVWDFPPSRFYAVLGPMGVALFFMITGYLFWDRLVRKAGRPGWLKLYVGRLFRIGPLYVAAVAAMLVMVAWKTGFHLAEPPLRVLKEIVKWSMLGIWPAVDVNGLDGTFALTAGVTWSLQYEWLFYFSLPALAVAARGPRLHLPFALGLLLAALALTIWRDGDVRLAHPAPCTALFAAGMTCASLRARGLALKAPGAAGSVGALLLTGLALSLFDGVLQAPVILLLGAAFYLIVSGASLFGLLHSRPARRLGDMSYSIYLLHGLLLAAAFSLAPLKALFLSSGSGHWAVTLVAGLAVVAASALTHRYIELPGIALGKAVAALAARPRARRLDQPMAGAGS